MAIPEENHAAASSFQKRPFNLPFMRPARLFETNRGNDVAKSVPANHNAPINGGEIVNPLTNSGTARHSRKKSMQHYEFVRKWHNRSFQERYLHPS